VLHERRRIGEIRVFALGVKRVYQHPGAGAALDHDVWEAFARPGIERAETGWILETNKSLNGAMEALAAGSSSATESTRDRWPPEVAIMPE
jgi:hypothetical protein